MMLLGWINLLGLLGIITQHTARWPIPKLERILCGASFIWLSLIMTGHSLSLFNQLNNPWLTCGASWLWLWGSLALFEKLAPFHSAPFHSTPSPLCPTLNLSFYHFNNPRFEKILIHTLLTLLALAALASLLLACNNLAGNADSVSYRLPRAFWYVSHGNLLHPFSALDPRTVYYPLNGTLLYTPLVVYGLPGVFHNIPTYLAWLLVGLTCYRFVREMGASCAISLLAVTLAVLTPNIMVQATATNDEILSGGALLLAVYYLLRWARSDHALYFLLSATMAGISIGTKLHIVFFLPVLALGLLLILVAGIHNPVTARAVWHHIGMKNFISSLLLGSSMIVPFLLYNYYSTGRFYFTADFANDFFNTQGKLHVMGQNSLIYLAQMFFAPVADLYGASDHVLREQFHAALNQFFTPLITPYLSTDAADYHLQYRFKGITLMVSPYYLEYSLWAGFSFMLAPLVWWQAARQRNTALGYPLLLLAGTPCIWFCTWCITTLYMEGTPTYLAYYLIIAAPALALLFLTHKNLWVSHLRWGLIGFVLLTHIIIDFNMLRFNEFRNIPRLFTTSRLPYDWELMDQTVINEVSAATKIRIAFTRWGMSYFGIMQHNPHAFYYGPQEIVPDSDHTLSLFSVPSAQYWGFAPLHIPHKPHPGAAFIGKMRGWGPEGVFAIGNNVAQRWPDRNRYVIFQARMMQTTDGLHIQLMDYTPGYHDLDTLEIRYEIWRGIRLETIRDWQATPLWDVTLPPNATSPTIKIFVRIPGMNDADAHYDLDMRAVRPWTEEMIGATAWIAPSDE